MLRFVSFQTFFLFGFFFLVGAFCTAEDSADAEHRILERYWEILIQSPKRGATFNRVYSHYVDIGQSTLLYQDCQTAAQNHPSDAGTWILFGLVAERRNQTEQATEAFQTAAELEPNNHLPMLYLGELLLNQRRTHEAIIALEQAHDRLQNNSGNKNDRRIVLQTLALAYERFGNPQKSLETWNQLADIFPNDPDILVQVAETMEFDGNFDEALKQYHRLISMTDDPAERIRLSLAAIDIMLRQGYADSAGYESALDELDFLLGLLDTESYLADAVRNRIDRIFERNRNPQGQIKFYQKRIEREPNDVASLLRLVKTLQKADRNVEAEKLLRDTIKISPSNISLQLTLIDLLCDRNDINGAVEQFQAIEQIDPTQTDYLIRWGTLVLQNPGVSESNRRIEVAKIWNRITEKSPNDPVTLVQVADLFLRNKFDSDAERCYKNALELRPNDFSYRESLAMFYHQQRRKDKVLETLLPADGNACNRGEVGYLLLKWGYLPEAMKILREAVQVNPQDWTLQYRYLEMLLQLDMPDRIQEAHEFFVNVEKQIAEDDQFDLFLQQEIQLLKSMQRIAEATKIVQSCLDTICSERTLWHLAVLYQADANFPLAIVSMKKALNMMQSPSLPFRRFAAELYEQSGNTSKAITFYQQLVQDDPARSGNYWQQIIMLQIQRGELSQALESSRNLLGRGTENAERLRFVADLFLSINRRDEAIKLLQQALSYEPGNTDILRILAQTFADSEQHEEAVELLWHLYERLDHFSAKLSVIEILTNEYDKLGKSEDLTEYLRQLSRNYEHRRESMQILVRVFVLQGNYEDAQNLLETLLDMPDESTNGAEFTSLWVLSELVSVSEKQGNLELAVQYQEAICLKTSELKEQDYLFHLYDKLGETAKAKKLFFNQVLRQGNLQDRLDLIDVMIRREQYEAVLQVLDFLEIHEPAHWETMFRRILIEAYQNKPVGSLVSEFRSMRFNDSAVPTVSVEHSQTFMFSDVAPTELNVLLTTQSRFLPILFHQEMRKSSRFQGQMSGEISEVQTFQDAQFLVLGWLLRDAMNKDFSTSRDTPTVMKQFRNTIEELRDMFPANSTKYDVLMERIRLEVWLLDFLHFDKQHQVFPTGMLKLQIDARSCQRTIWQIVRNSALDNISDWQPALFQIFVTECINELVANRFKTLLLSDSKLSEKLSQILDNLCQERTIPPIYAEDQNRMVHFATYLVKQSAIDHQTSLLDRPVTLSQKTDRLLSIWTEFVENTHSETRTKYQFYFASRYGTLLWILRSQNRETDVKFLEQSLRKTAHNHPLWFAENIADLTQPVDENLILFLSLSGYDSLEVQLHRIKNSVVDILPFCTEKVLNRAVCEYVFQHLCSLLQTERLQRYDIFTQPERILLGMPIPQIWNYLQIPSQVEQGQFARQFFGIDAPYPSHQQILKMDQMNRLTELDRSLRQINDYAFQLLDELNIEPLDLSPVVPTSAGKITLTRYRLELQGDRPINRSIIYSLVQNLDITSNFSAVNELFCRIILLRRALDTKTKFVAMKTDERIVPIQENYTEQFDQFLENKKQSTVLSDRNWSHHVSTTFCDLLKTNDQKTKNSAKSSHDAELVQLVRRLETTDGRRLTFAEQLALALLYVRLQRFVDAVATLDSIELNDATDLLAREWIAANLAIKQAKTDATLSLRGDEAANRLLNFRLSERDSLNLVPVLQHFNRAKDAQQIWDYLSATVSDRRLLAELFYKMNSADEQQKENAAKIAHRILGNPAFLQNSRRLTADVYLLESAIKTLQEQNQTKTIVPILENRLCGLRDKTDSRILRAKLYLMLDRHEEAKTLAFELAQNPILEPERRQMVVSLLIHFGLHKELEAMNRLLFERNEEP